MIEIEHYSVVHFSINAARRPFDVNTYEEDQGDPTLRDDVGRQRIKLHVGCVHVWSGR